MRLKELSYIYTTIKFTNLKTVYHPSESRGYANHGWLEARHSFSFANWYDPNRTHFGALRVLNDDIIAPSRGFGTHPHSNMEIITIPLKGDLEHQDSMGNVEVIKEGEIQVMSAGSGVQHSEYNKNDDRPINLLQLWIFPDKQNATPRYDQQTIRDLYTQNDFFQILSPSSEDQGVWIHQNSWFHLLYTNTTVEKEYRLKDPSNGVYCFVIEGSVHIENQTLNLRDALGVWETDSIFIKAASQTKLLLIEVPMIF